RDWSSDVCSSDLSSTSSYLGTSAFESCFTNVSCAFVAVNTPRAISIYMFFMVLVFKQFTGSYSSSFQIFQSVMIESGRNHTHLQPVVAFFYHGNIYHFSRSIKEHECAIFFRFHLKVITKRIGINVY